MCGAWYRFEVHPFAASLEQRFAQAVADERAKGGCAHPPRAFRMPPAVRTTLLAAMRFEAALVEKLTAYYADKLPRLRVEQLERATEPAAMLLRRPLLPERVPRFFESLHGLYAALLEEGLDPSLLTGHASVQSLLAARPCAVELYEPTLHGLGLPMLGAYPAERAACGEELASGRDPDEVFDIHIGGNLTHELCHGPALEVADTPESWMLLESAAIHLGYVARPAHIFPEELGEAVPSVAPFVMIGEALARHFGRRRLWSMSFGATAASSFGPDVAAAIDTASWQDLLSRGTPPFVQDALRAEAWVKLIDGARAGHFTSGADVLEQASRTPWSQLPWWSQPATEDDHRFLITAVRSLFHVNVLAPSFQTHPAEIPDGRISIDLEACQLRVAARPHGVYAEPAHWVFPPSLSRQLHERGARTLLFEGARHRDYAGIAAMLFDVANQRDPLPRQKVLRWTSSA